MAEQGQEGIGNLLYYGDNLDVMRRHIKDEAVDLVYLDPPFNSNKSYNIMFKEKNGSRAASQVLAYEDTWTWNQESESTFAELVTAGGCVADCLHALRVFLSECDMMAYLVMMAPRLVELRRVMKPTASIYLHCDPTASHYLKMLMDAVFGGECFVNEIVWHYRKWPSGKYTFQHNHDIILFYARSRSTRRTFNQLYMTRAASTLKRFGTARIISGYDEKGRRVPAQMASEDSEGVRQDDVWEIGRVPPIKQLGPTEKPLSLLKRIISASSNPGDIVLDPFGGCGTTIVASETLGRPWIGIDIAYQAIYRTKERLNDSFGGAVMFKTIGEPVSLPDAKQLAESDPYQFQWWALGLVGARPVEQKKGADKGVDGRIYFQGDERGNFETVIISVKAGHVTANHVRDLCGVVGREKAAIGVLISMENPTKPMKTEAIKAGLYEPGTWGQKYEKWGQKYPKIQLLTVAELLAGKKIEMPPIQQVGATFKKAPKVTKQQGEQLELTG